MRVDDNIRNKHPGHPIISFILVQTLSHLPNLIFKAETQDIASLFTIHPSTIPGWERPALLNLKIVHTKMSRYDMSQKPGYKMETTKNSLSGTPALYGETTGKEIFLKSLPGNDTRYPGTGKKPVCTTFRIDSH